MFSLSTSGVFVIHFHKRFIFLDSTIPPNWPVSRGYSPWIELQTRQPVNVTKTPQIQIAKFKRFKTQYTSYTNIHQTQKLSGQIDQASPIPTGGIFLVWSVFATTECVPGSTGTIPDWRGRLTIISKYLSSTVHVQCYTHCKYLTSEWALPSWELCRTEWLN